MKVKEILNMSIKEFEKIMTEEDWDLIRQTRLQYAWQALELYQDSAKNSDMEDDDEFESLTEFLKYYVELVNEDYEFESNF